MAVLGFINGDDVFVCLPTGYGKSLCYYCLPSVFDMMSHCTYPWSIVIVVSPLSALMHDQVESLKNKGLSAVVAMGNDEYVQESIK